MEKSRTLSLSFTVGLLLCGMSAFPQNLADIARQEKEKRDQQKATVKVYTNDDLTRYDHLNEKSAQNQAAEPGTTSPESSKRSAPTSTQSEERLWSKRFIDAKAKIEQLKQQGETLQANMKDFNMRLLMQSDVYDREHLYPELLAQTQKQIEKNKSDLAEAEQALDDLRDELRKGGYPRSWEDSQAALKPLPDSTNGNQPKVKNQQYWQEQLAAIDKKYDELIAPLDKQRFEMIHRVAPKEGQNIAQQGYLGLGAPPMVNELDAKIKELNQKRDQEKKELIEQALREGALPGWFR